MSRQDEILALCFSRVKEEFRTRLHHQRRVRHDRNLLRALRLIGDNDAMILENVKAWKLGSWVHDISDEEVIEAIEKYYNV